MVVEVQFLLSYLCSRLGGVEVPFGVVDLGAVGPEGLLPEGGELRGGRHLLVR